MKDTHPIDFASRKAAIAWNPNGYLEIELVSRVSIGRRVANLVVVVLVLGLFGALWDSLWGLTESDVKGLSIAILVLALALKLRQLENGYLFSAEGVASLRRPNAWRLFRPQVLDFRHSRFVGIWPLHLRAVNDGLFLMEDVDFHSKVFVSLALQRFYPELEIRGMRDLSAEETKNAEIALDELFAKRPDL